MSVFYLRVNHLFPFRTEKCSRVNLMILAASAAGKVGYADIKASYAVFLSRFLYNISMRHVKQLVYGILYLILLAAFVGGIYSWAKPVPTCFDGRQNRDETGVDCGGRCAKVCVPAAIASLVQNGEPKLVLLVTSADTGLAAVPRVSVVSEIRNPNQDFGASKFDYVFKIYDPSGAEIASFPDSSYIYPGEIKRIVLLNKTLPAGSSPAAARLILQSPLWVPLERFPRPKLSIQTVNTTEERGTLVVKGTLVNQDSVDFQTVE